VTVTPLPVQRDVVHLMGMPVSVALRGRHTHDRAAQRAWKQCVAELTEVDRVFSTFREDSCISRLSRGEIELADCPPESEHESSRAAPSTYDVPDRRARQFSTRAAW
jgi:thiamine biosynthesis lipoprotein